MSGPDGREEQLAGRLAAPLPGERAALERNWQGFLAARHRAPRRRWGALRSAASAITLLGVVVVGLGWWQQVRLDVAGDRRPVLYRELVAETSFDSTALDTRRRDTTFSLAQLQGKPAISGTLVIVQKRVDGPRADRLSVVAGADVRIDGSVLPATIELRFRSPGDASYGLLARTEGLNDPRRATGQTRTTYEAPLPPIERGHSATYRIWIHVETAIGDVESPVLVVTVTERAEGQRATSEVP